MPQTALIEELQELFLSQPLEHWERVLGEVDCCCEVIPNLNRVKEHPQVQARGLLSGWEPAYPAWVNGAPCKPGPALQRISDGESIDWLARE